MPCAYPAVNQCGRAGTDPCEIVEKGEAVGFAHEKGKRARLFQGIFPPSVQGTRSGTRGALCVGIHHKYWRGYPYICAGEEAPSSLNEKVGKGIFVHRACRMHILFYVFGKGAVKPCPVCRMWPKISQSSWDFSGLMREMGKKWECFPLHADTNVRLFFLLSRGSIRICGHNTSMPRGADKGSRANIWSPPP